jgi:hypothetical protein
MIGIELVSLLLGDFFISFKKKLFNFYILIKLCIIIWIDHIKKTYVIFFSLNNIRKKLNYVYAFDRNN